jgi:hypothetical protein
MLTSKKTWQDRATEKALRTKITRKKHPMTTFAELAMEFGAPLDNSSMATSPAFRKHVRSTLGTEQVFSS